MLLPDGTCGSESDSPSHLHTTLLSKVGCFQSHFIFFFFFSRHASEKSPFALLFIGMILQGAGDDMRYREIRSLARVNA